MYTKLEITCTAMWYFSHYDFVFCLLAPLWSQLPGYVIKDAVEENYESDHDSWLLNK